MRVFLGAIICALALGACSPSKLGDETTGTADPSPAPASPTAGPTTSSPTVTGDGTHSGDRALEHVRMLSEEIGPRVAGTEGEDEAAEYIRAYLEELGYEAELRPFEFETDRFRPADLSVDGMLYEASTIAGSPAGAVAGPLRYVRLADEAGIAGQDLAGAVAVADRGELRFVEKAQAVAGAGAVALLIINHEPGLFFGELGGESPIPVVAVRQEDGPAFEAAAAAGMQAILAVEAMNVAAVNVLAMPPGTQRCEILVGGHFDTVPGAPGANDNASGTGNVLELARAFAFDGLKAGLCFAAFGAEESGLNGSEAMVASLRAEAELPRYMLNIDVTGIGEDVEIVAQDEALAAVAEEAAAKAGVTTVRTQVAIGTSSDHASFEDAGVPTVYYSSGGFPTIHSAGDVFADIEVDVLDRVGDAAHALIVELLAEVAP